MATPFTPVMCECTHCKRRFVEWWLTSDIASKPPGIVKKSPCDTCYAPRCSEEERANIVRLCLRRRQAMHEKWWNDCDKRHLPSDVVAWLNRGVSAYYAHKPAYTDQLHGLANDRTESNDSSHLPH